MVAVLLAIPVYSWAVSDKEVDKACEKISAYAEQGKKAYQAKKYDQARRHFTKQVGWSESCQLSEDKIATARKNVALTYIGEGEYLKAKAWLTLDPKNSKSINNLKQLDDKLDNLPVPASPEGEYWQYAGQGFWNTLVIAPKEDRYSVSFYGYAPGLMAMFNGPNIGEFSGYITISEGKAVYQQRESDLSYGNCDVHMAFATDSIMLATVGDCGFGARVMAEGKFDRVSTKVLPALPRQR